VLRLLDAHTGSRAEVKPARPGLLRVCAHVPGDAPEDAGVSGATALRVLLVADLVARVAELGNLQALTMLVTGDESAERMSALESAASALGIHPPAGRARSGNAPALPGGAADIHVISSGVDVRDAQSGVVTRVGDAHTHGTWAHERWAHGTGAHGRGAADPLPAGEHDPLAVRLALMSFRLHQPADLTDRVVTDARETVRDWRRRVARWAESPSKSIPAHLAEVVQAAFGDLDTPSTVALLHGLAHDDSVPAGAKFETFVYADRVLGLDLPSEIGRS
jgi:hypothetical protein